MQEVDVLITNAEYVITVDSERRIFRDGAIAVSDSKIKDIGKTAELTNKYVGKKTIDATRKVIVPGFIDGHIHSAFQMSRGLADEVGAQKFLFERMYPYEGYLDEEDNYWSSMLCCLELLRHGVTTFIDPGNYHPAATAQAVSQVGMRSIIGKSTMDIAKSGFGSLPPTFNETMEEGLERSEEVIKKFHGSEGGRIRASLCFRGVNNCTDQLIRRMKEMADHYEISMQAHACFAKETRDASVAAHNAPEVERLHNLGVLDSNMLLIHMGWATPKEILLLGDNDVKITAAPSSSLHNAYGNIGMGSVPELLEMGLAVGIGSDHSSSGIVDICQEMLLLAGGYKEARIDPKIMPPETVLEMATINGARCALWEDEIGSLEVGKEADMVMFNTETPEWQPLYNPVSNLVYSAHGGTVDTVLIGGKTVVQAGEVLTLDDNDIYKHVRQIQPKILEKTGLEEIMQTTWPIY
ncbi:amidohydrolase family protein [Alteribacillus sp. YIM 98480]|uniref:amidohydrolase family protein n=1 Tax=Alteribacillus sp. YIM 98480 TaxID=2606599 RepID=UPI00131D1809|nr:amidohydrolase [Alteribacillus sp. YIM 98480]